jgi:hypothetical protein
VVDRDRLEVYVMADNDFRGLRPAEVPDANVNAAFMQARIREAGEYFAGSRRTADTVDCF